MTLSDFAKYSVARSIVQSLRQLSFLSSVDICFADVGRGEKERGREKGRGGEETTTCHEANKPRRSVIIIRCVLSRMFCTVVAMIRRINLNSSHGNDYVLADTTITTTRHSLTIYDAVDARR